MRTEQLGTAGIEAAAPYPVDISTMRAMALRLIGPDSGPDVLPPAGDELAALTATLRGSIELLTPEVEVSAAKLPRDSALRYCALACVGEARGKLRADPGLSGGVVYAQKLARVLTSLCDHYDSLSAEPETPETAALRRLGEHCTSCPTCMTVDENGANLRLPCKESERLHAEYRQACRSAAASVPGGRQHLSEAAG